MILKNHYGKVNRKQVGDNVLNLRLKEVSFKRGKVTKFSGIPEIVTIRT